MSASVMKRSRFDRRLDKLREAEEKGQLGHKKMNRSLRKLLNNRLAVIGVIIFGSYFVIGDFCATFNAV